MKHIWQLFRKKSGKTLKILTGIFAILIVFITTYLLILPAITIDREVAKYEPGMELPAGTNIPAFEEINNSGIPENADLVIEEILNGSEQYEQYVLKTENVLGMEDGAGYIRLFDISIVDKNDPDILYQPAEGTTVAVSIDLADAGDESSLSVVHFADEDAEGDVIDSAIETLDEGQSVSFETDGSSVYAVAGYTMEKTIEAGDGSTYKISITFRENAKLPEDVDIAVSEIDGEEYADYVGRTSAALYASGFEYARVFDISIVDEDGAELQPSGQVDVEITLLDAQNTDDFFDVVHFAKEGESEEARLVDTDTEGNTVSFHTDSFSAYAIVQGPSEIPIGWQQLSSLDELSTHASDGLYIGTTSGYYLTDTTAVGTSDSATTGIVKTKPAQSYPADAAVKYYFEAAEETDQFYIYCLKDGEKYYIQNTGDANVYLTDLISDRTAFTVISDSNKRFRFQNGDRYLNMWKGANGNHIAAWTTANDTNNYFYIWQYVESDTDPYGLDGKTYGLMNWAGGVAGKAMMASTTGNALDAKALIVMSTTNNSSQLFVPNESDISLWTFKWIGGDKYSISTVADGSTKFLRIDPGGLSLVSSESEASQIQAIPGTGTHAGEICLKSGNTTLTFSGTVENGFSVGGSVGNEWLYFVEVSELTQDYFLTYSAEKISVSDTKITNGSRVIVYTRSWNEDKLKYDYYAISSDGTLVPVYESGDSIEWVSGQINTLLWNLVEYYWEGTNDPNYYYELYNQYSEKFIAPQEQGMQILSDDTIGIHLNGRRDGQYYSTILAWDEDYYSYVGLKVEDGHIVPCPRSEAMDFYFAVMQDLNVNDSLNTVATIDNTQYGITMKIKDYGSPTTIDGQATSTDQHVVMGTNKWVTGQYVPGLLSTNLEENGYPTVVSNGNSLEPLYTDALEVNHLFIESTYKASGYYEYNSAQNYAYLNGTDFVVYKELGTQDNNNNIWSKHGQFLPFNDIEAGKFASVNSENLYSPVGAQLPDSDPRKHERLYLVSNPNYYYGVELEASFVQTPSGLDAWGHDIIYEFNGDDDFWLYVDGELVIDLGGIHDAMSGSVNFRTGQVIVKGAETTLYDLFYNNYIGRGYTAEQAQAHVNSIFVLNENEQYVFKDDTTHTMKIFYMERGAGAANLQMRFNLASVKKGTVQLSKELSGVDSFENVLAEFPYQILYTTENGEYYLQNAIPHSSTQDTDYVYYKDTVTPVEYRQSITIGGKIYNDVFFLEPGETADISFPEGMVSYKIIECGVNTDVYSNVTVKNETVDAIDVPDSSNRKDYAIGYNTTDNRARVNYVNEVNPNALKNLTIEKRLFKENGEDRIYYPTDETTFTFRLYMATEFDELDVANMHTYHVKNREGIYCRWDVDQKKLVPLESEGTVFSELTDEDKEAATFTTSIYGSIADIPIDYVIEVRNVLAGTKFGVVERPWEVPDGYSFQKYIYNGEEQTVPAETGVRDVVVSSIDPNVTVCNLKGWGLRVNKVWTDSAFMADRGDAYFAIYTNNNGTETLVDGTVRQLKFNANPQTIYWYFQTLPVSNVSLADYMIREVTLTGDGITVDDDGVVKDYTTITPIAESGELSIGGRQKGEEAGSVFKYTVTYERGEISNSSNVRVDTVTNDRPGIILKKMQWDGNTPLAGAVFTLTDGSSLIGTFTSDEDGLITVAFLRDDVDYVLAEIRAPAAWHGLERPLKIRLHSSEVTVTEADESYYSISQGSGVIPTLTVKDRPYQLHAVKMDGDKNTPMEGVKFKLHRQVTVDGITTIDLNPMPGYEELVTDSNGHIEKIDNTLPAGTYELREKELPNGFASINHIQFTISETGEITLADSHPEGVTLTKNTEGTEIQYVMTIPNHRVVNITLKKVDNNNKALNGSKFTLCRLVDSAWEKVTGYADIDLTNASQTVLQNLGVGRYRLTETKAPDSYVILSRDIYFTISPATGGNVSISLTDADGNGSTYENASVSGQTITVMNVPGDELPMTGGPGRSFYIFSGIALILAAALIYGFRSRRRKEAEKTHNSPAE